MINSQIDNLPDEPQLVDASPASTTRRPQDNLVRVHNAAIRAAMLAIRGTVERKTAIAAVEALLHVEGVTIGNDEQDAGESAWHIGVTAAKRQAKEVFEGSCNHTHDAIEFMTSLLLVEEPEKSNAELANWVAEQWAIEVKHRPLTNIHRRPLDGAWRRMLRHLDVDDRARLGPTHDDLREDISIKDWEAMGAKASSSACLSEDDAKQMMDVAFSSTIRNEWFGLHQHWYMRGLRDRESRR